MSGFVIPTLGELIDRSRQAFRSYLPGTDAWMWPNNITPTAKVIGGMMFELHQRLAFVERQKFASTADGEYLDRHAAEIGLSRNPAAKATGNVTFTSTGALSVGPGAIVSRTDGARFVVTVGGSRNSAGTLTLPVIAEVAGKAGVTLEGSPLSVVTGTVGTSTVAVAAGGLVGGADLEPDGEYYTTDLGTLRGRVLFRKRFPPHGGAPPDYVEWALETPGVTRVYVERQWNGSGTVRMFPLTDGATSNGIPSTAILTAVRQTMDLKAPAGAAVTVSAPTALPIDIIVSGLDPSTVAVQEAIRAELRDTFARLGRASGNDSPHPAMSFLATPATFSRSWIWQAIANATGESRHVLVLPNADTTVPAGYLPTLGSVTFT